MPHVSKTRIFGRTSGETEHLVYSMDLAAEGDIAMILPLPVEPGRGEEALAFVNLEGYPGLFDDIEKGFPQLRPQALRSGFAPRAAALTLKVHTVGAFEASFVPHPSEFGRLDPRFRLSPEVWGALPQYDDYGFAVFRFTPGSKKTIHPMAMSFHTRFADHIFFPTVHVHDGRVHPKAEFDHSLYYQRGGASTTEGNEEVSFDTAATFVRCADTKGLVEPAVRVWKRTLRGQMQNSDFFVKA
ncbi:MAG: hypothetical protein U0174_17635 [Polyangiaceae bacterium]